MFSDGMRFYLEDCESKVKNHNLLINGKPVISDIMKIKKKKE